MQHDDIIDAFCLIAFVGLLNGGESYATHY